MQNNYSKYLSDLGFNAFNEMQNAMFSACASNQDIILLSATGSGKTVGFLLPILERLSPDIKDTQALILAPSRELAIQIEQVFKSIGSGYKISCCYGGHSTRIEKNNLIEPPAVLVGTPGRIAYHIEKYNVSTKNIKRLVLDEFDKSLEFGFAEDMSFIIRELEHLEQKLLTSATKMDDIPAFTGIKKAKTISFISDEPIRTLELKQVKSIGNDKLNALFQLLCSFGNSSTLVFCNHRDAVERISDLLLDMKLKHGIFHGGMLQEDRERSLIKFRNGSHHILITTDLASRGLDIPEIKNVVHYQLPSTEDSYIHRNGRTARMNATGTAYLVMSEKDFLPEFISEEPQTIELLENQELPEAPQWTTIFINKGKKDKVNKIDIVGLMLKKGELSKENVGKIEVLDHSSFVAVKSDIARQLIQKVKNERIKNKKAIIAIAR